jgi:hypothetical protein
VGKSRDDLAAPAKEEHAGAHAVHPSLQEQRKGVGGHHIEPGRQFLAGRGVVHAVPRGRSDRAGRLEDEGKSAVGHDASRVRIVQNRLRRRVDAGVAGNPQYFGLV